MFTSAKTTSPEVEISVPEDQVLYGEECVFRTEMPSFFTQGWLEGGGGGSSSWGTRWKRGNSDAKLEIASNKTNTKFPKKITFVNN